MELKQQYYVMVRRYSIKINIDRFTLPLPNKMSKFAQVIMLET